VSSNWSLTVWKFRNRSVMIPHAVSLEGETEFVPDPGFGSSAPNLKRKMKMYRDAYDTELCL
jgi:hypothetical protein